MVGVKPDTEVPETNPRKDKLFVVGDVVFDVDRPQWGNGSVVKVHAYPKNSGQKLTIDFEKRGLISVYSSMRVLKHVDQ